MFKECDSCQKDYKGEIVKQICGKQGCNNPAVAIVHGDLLYYTCKKHKAEIQALVDSE